ncbi:amino acid adenylation domain-containing protein [Actinoplanes sp. NPDC049316]|uniref:non-ribosomal peptide synthetase n=1 Tax=Actinoplanes sp. NPDC049316 TaxID=3154727 RepID=UPI00341A611E
MSDHPTAGASEAREELLRRRLAGTSAGRRRPAIGPADRSGPLPLSYGQQQMWFLNRLEPDSAEYLVPLVVRLRGPLDTAALSEAWLRLLDRHEILRTRYRMDGGEVTQVIDAKGTAELRLSVPAGAAPERETAALALVREDLSRPFDLAEDQPVRARLIRLADDEHLLALVFHHIAFDAWSIGIVGRELSEDYAAALAGTGSPRPPLIVQYADFASWQREQLSAGALDRHLAYWRERLAGLPYLELPTDRPRPARRDGAGAVVPLALPAELMTGVRALAARHDATPFMVLLAAYQAVLARWSGRADVPVGTVVSGRVRPEVQDLIGYGINSLVLRGRWDGDPSFAALLGSVRDTVLEAFDHQAMPFARLVDELQPERDLSRTPLFQVAFTMHGDRATTFELPGVEALAYEGAGGGAKFDLDLQLHEAADGSLGGRLEYATALFDETTAERLAGHVIRLLAAAVADPGTRLSGIDLVAPEELPVLAAAPSAAETTPVTATAVEVFERQARATPDAPAVTYAGESLTYRELNERANRIAHHLIATGAGPGSLVGVSLDRGAELVPALLGVLKAGAGYLPLDPAQPADRIAFILADADVATLVTEPRHAEKLGAVHEGRLLVLDADAVRDQPGDDPAVRATPADLAYVIYTSGSTGRPKGVGVTHANVLRLFTVTDGRFHFSATDVWTLFHSYAFDFSVWELWGALLYGGRLVVVPHDVTRSPADFLDLLIAERVTILNQTPSSFRSLVALAADPRLDALSLRAVVFGGERLEPAELRPWVQRLGLDAPELINMYGITETTVHVTYHRLTAADLDPHAGSPVGSPLGDLRVHLLDEAGALVPTGVAGEICVGGPGVARGYLGRPALTAERFVPDPYGPAGSRLYRSGDLARRRADGSLEFLGRADDQVKIRGFRIELGEIAAALAALPEVHDAVVVVRGTGADQRLVAYVVPAAGDGLDRAALRAALARTLSDYMVPSAFVPVERIPLTGNGKLDKAALPEPDGDTLLGGREHINPRTVTEERLAEVWTRVLGLDRAGVTEPFFELGGDSIKAVALVGELRAAGFDIAVRDVFEHRTIADLAELLTGRPALDQLDPVVAPFELVTDADRAKLPAGAVDAYPMAQTQVGMVVEMLNDTALHVYHNVTSFRVRDQQSFDVDALRRAVHRIVQRHEILRTSLDLTGYSVPMQVVHASAEMPVAVRDLRGLTADELDRSLRDFTTEERGRLFDLAVPPLFRVTAHQHDGAWWLTATECHPILEGWSCHSLIMEIIEVYRALRTGADVPEQPEPAVRYADFIAAEGRSLASDEDRSYWQSIVDANARFSLPQAWAGDPARPREKYRVAVPWHDLEDGLRKLAVTARASLKSVLLSAHLKVMSMLTEEESFVTGLVCNGRPEASGADRVYGMYLNTVPFAFDRGARTWEELVRRVFAREVGLWPHRRFPMSEIQRAAGVDRLLTVRFSYHDFHQVDRELVDYLASIDDSPTEFPFAVSARVGHITLTTDTHALSRGSAESLAGLYRRVLESMAAGGGGDALASYLSVEERERVLVEWNESAVEVEPLTVLQLFEARVAQDPDAVALRFGDETTTYAELDRRACGFARALRERGVGTESRVAVLLDRSPDLVAALLGVWKAGGAYVPVDPSYPAERIAAMVETAGVSVSVTSDSYADRFGPAAVLLTDSVGLGAAVPRADLIGGLAYVIFTSGSTGRPKGVEISHAGLANHVVWARDVLASRGSGGAPLFSSVAFDLVVPNLWGPLVAGQAVRLVGQDVDVADLGTAIVDGGPYSFIKLTPAHLEMLTSGLSADLASVLVVAGEALPATLADRVLEILGPGRLVNEYGPTEASVGTCVFPVEAASDRDVVPIGRPLPNMRMYVLDSALEPVPVGVVGELFVGGAGVARGYAGRADLTAERFLPDPFGSGGRLYRTGDVVRWLPSGDVEFLGRADDQVKIRGYRVELGEVRAVVAEHPAVRDAVVSVFERSLVAYVVPADGAGLDAAALADWCRTRLPEYMVPSAFAALDRIPLTANGKVDRRALPSPDDIAADDGYVAPRTVTEERVARIWADVLGRERVGVNDGFFELGGHSIRAVALVGALRGAGFDVGVREVFEHRTVAELCEFLTGRPGAAEVEEYVAPFAQVSAEDRAKLPAGAVDAYPLSQVQLGMLVEMFADREQHAYHNVSSFRVRDGKPFATDALRAAAAVVVARHEMLRTSFHLDSWSVPLQVVHATAEIPVAIGDLRGLDEDARRQALADLTARERATLFDLERAPLLRMTAHVEDDGAWWLTVTVCHAITEGWSHRALLMELLEEYARLRDGEPAAERPVPAVRYADFIAAEGRSLASEDDRGYWQSIVDGYARFTLPSAWAGDASQPREKYRVAVPLRDLEAGLRGLAVRSGASLKSVLLAAHLKVMSVLTSDETFFTGLVFSARPEAPGADRVYGMYLNTLPFAVDRGARTWEDLVRRVFAREAEVWGHRRYPMPAVQRLAAVDRLLDVRFSYQDFDHVDTDLVDAERSAGEGATEFGLAVSAVGGYLLLTTHTHALSRESAESLTGLYRRVLESMAAGAGGDALASYLSVEERERVLVRWNESAVDVEPLTVLQLFEAQVAKDPDAVALRSGDETMTYADLDRRAAQFAHALRERGVGTESRVAVLLDRSPDLVAALLGVWKTGGAYVPVDPSYPAERIAAMVQTAGVSVAVTSGSYAGRFGPTTVLLPGSLGENAPVARADLIGGLAYVIFTSGSTGRPKGVEVSHAGLVNHVVWARDVLASRGSGGAPLFSSVAFDLVVPNLWGPLVAGQAARLVGQDVDVADLGAALVEGSPYAFVKLTPAHLEVLTSQLSAEQAEDLASVLVVAGEALPATLADRALEILGPGRLVNEYGPTEASVGTCVFPVVEASDRDVVPIGRPLPNMRMYVLDPALEPVPVGVVGELFVGGTGVARGYAGRADLTAERFLPDPFSEGGRLYRTGDVVRWLPSGDVEFLGRADDQVKIRGYRVELGEVRAIVADHPAVRDAVVSVFEPTPGDRRLVAYVVPADGTADAGELGQWCRVRLPEYMVPSAFVALDRIPLNANGKVDRRALPAPDRSTMDTGEEFVAPETPTERLLAGIWSEVLGVAQIGVHDRFADLGGHSLLMIKVLAAARQAGLTVSIWRMYQHETLHDLAAAIDADQAEAAAESAAAVAPTAEEQEEKQVTVSADLLADLLRRAGGASAADPRLAEAAALVDRARAVLPELADGLRVVMAANHVPGASFALLRDGEVAETLALGVLGAGGDAAVDPGTIFQAGSISKHLTAFATLRLVADGLLDLDRDVEAYLTSWRPAADPAAPGPLTLRHLLGHRAGLARHRSVGFRPGEPVPTLLDLLSGRPPAVNPEVRRELAPGSAFRKSSTHYWVVQQLLEDVTGEAFEPLMRRLVLDPLAMTGSSFAQDFPRTAGRGVALGHDRRGAVLDGGWRERGHLAAAGLWSTAGDLAAFAAELRRCLRGEPGALLAEPYARQLVAAEPGGFYGLGTIVDDTGADLEYGHGGEPAGYWTMAISRAAGGTGFVALTNADGGKDVVRHLTAALAERDGSFGRGSLAAGWAGTAGPDVGAAAAVLRPVVTDDERA